MDEEAFELDKELLLLWDLHSALQKGEMTAAERILLAKRFGVSEDVLLRYERATSTYFTAVFDPLRYQARVEVARRRRQLGKELWSDEYFAELIKARERLEAAAPENEITREYKEAKAALKAALEAAPLAWEPAPKDILLNRAMSRAKRSDGLTAEVLRALAERFGVSEEVLLRFERATSAVNDLFDAKEARQASLEAQRRLAERGDLPPPSRERDASSKEDAEAERWDAMLEKEDEIRREQKEAVAALMAALYGSPSTSEK